MKKRILIVEDEKQLADTLQKKLRNAGYECDLAFDGAQGLKKIQEESFDLVLLDLLMPKMDGFDFLRAHDASHSPILVLSNLSDQGEVARAEGLGANKYMVKSNSSLDDVLGGIRQIIGGPDKGN